METSAQMPAPTGRLCAIASSSATDTEVAAAAAAVTG